MGLCCVWAFQVFILYASPNAGYRICHGSVTLTIELGGGPAAPILAFLAPGSFLLFDKPLRLLACAIHLQPIKEVTALRLGTMSQSDDAPVSPTSNSPDSLTEAAQKQDAEKPRLTRDQKKNNHITSEQNRRNFLRSQFNRLAELVPDAKGKARSEALVLERLLEYGHAQLKEGKKMIEEIESQGGAVEQELKKKYFETPKADGFGGWS